MNIDEDEYSDALAVVAVWGPGGLEASDLARNMNIRQSHAIELLKEIVARRQGEYVPHDGWNIRVRFAFRGSHQA